jgi:O-acetyl-ADP-ribose deacetylase
LGGAFARALELAVEHDCRSVAFPALSTGVYGYPLADAALVALTKVITFLNQQDRPEIVRFVLFDDVAFDKFATTLAKLTGVAPEAIV